MSDPLSTHPVRALESQDAADREARIEELLLSGLDHYFAGHYERAVSVWTRIIFLDRNHDRARAYIERARSAMAERQRESDELLHDGVAAYNAGEVDKARALLTQALEQGSESADLFLGRLNRVGTASAVAVETESEPPTRRAATPGRRVALTPRPGGWTAAVLAACVLVALMLIGGLPVVTSLIEPEAAAPAQTPQPAPEDPLPVVRSSETTLAHARTLYGGGHLHDALRALDRIGMADPFRADADRLRADIQRDLFVAAGLSGSVPASDSRP